MNSALDGITVLDLTDGMAGALATMFLCDNGARVIRLASEASERNRQSPGYAVWDRGKESVLLDLTRALPTVEPEGRRSSGKMADAPELAYFSKLIAGADVLIESFAPSSAVQALVSYDLLSAINPRLVHCSITAYGRQGPHRDQPAVDDLVMARLGLLPNLPDLRPGPVHLVHPLPSIGSGILAAQGITAALYARENTGTGLKVDTSLMAGALLYTPKIAWDGAPQRRAPRGLVPAFWRTYECEDGQWIQMACVDERFAVMAAAAMGMAEFLDDPNFDGGRIRPTNDARHPLIDIVADAMKTRPYEEWAALFEDADVPHARVGTVDQAMDDPQVRHNDMVIRHRDPELGVMSTMGLPVKLTGTPGKIRGPRPKPGQHTDEVLSGVSELEPPNPTFSKVESGPRSRPLHGVKVIEIANVIAGPAAGYMLSELGAEIEKLEPPDGDISRVGDAPHFPFHNTNKKSVCIDARTDEGREVVARLVASADVLLSNMRPGATDRLGIGSDALEELNPSIIESHLTAFGWTGPYSHRPGLDPLAQALIGLQRSQSGPENPPVFLSRLVPNDYTAAAVCALGAVMALFARERTGAGQKVRTSLLNAGIVVSSETFMRYPGKPPIRYADKNGYGLAALHRLYSTADGWIYLAAEEDDCWPRLCSALDRGDLASDPRFASEDGRGEDDRALAEELASTLAARTTGDWLQLLERTNIPCAPVLEEGDKGFFTDPHALANDMVVELVHPDIGKYRIGRTLIRFSDTSDMEPRPTSLLGQHNREVLESLGYAQSDIDELYRKGVANDTVKQQAEVEVQ